MSAKPIPEGEKLAEVARQVAENLVAALELAERQTDRWTNELLADALIDQAMSTCMAKLSRTGCWGRDNQIPSGELWRIAEKWLEVGVLQERARNKPLGYAGDFLMLDWIIRWQCCEHPLGRFFDRFFQRQAAPEAVRARTLMAAGAIAEGVLAHGGKEFQVASVGVGPGADVAEAAAMLPHSHRDMLRITLLDLDESGLKFAADQVRRHIAHDHVVTLRDNLFRLARNKAVAESLYGANFILCTGLFDYLEDEAAAGLLCLFWQSLAPGGHMLVGNFAPHCPTRAYMEWIGNWYLNYRTAEQLAALGDGAEIPREHCSVFAERLGIDWFFSARKK